MSSSDEQTERAHLQREQDDFLRGVKRQCANTEPHGPHVWGKNLACLGVSAPTDRTETTEQVGGVIYTWQMLNGDRWNIIGMGTPSGAVLPMISSDLNIAWMGMEVAQAHADRQRCKVRLAAFNYADVLAIVHPQETGDE